MILDELIELCRDPEYEDIKIYIGTEGDTYNTGSWYADDMPPKYRDCKVLGWLIDEHGKLCVHIDY